MTSVHGFKLARMSVGVEQISVPSVMAELQLGEELLVYCGAALLLCIAIHQPHSIVSMIVERKMGQM